MAKKLVVVLNRSAVSRALLRGPGFRDFCRKKAEEIKTRAGDGFGTLPNSGQTRVSVLIRAKTKHAYYSNRKHNTLLKAIRG